MKRLYSLFVIAVISISAASCSLDDDRTNFEYTTLKTSSVVLPDTFELGRVYRVDVNLLRPNNCTLPETFSFDRSVTDTTNIRTIAAIGVILDRNDCEVANDSVQDSFQFEVVYSDPYLFRFYTGDDASGEPEFLELSVPVK